VRFCTFAIHNQALEDSSVLWIFVAIMQLKIKSILIARKLLVYFFGQKI